MQFWRSEMLIPTYPPKEGYGNLRWRGGGCLLKTTIPVSIKLNGNFQGGMRRFWKFMWMWMSQKNDSFSVYFSRNQHWVIFHASFNSAEILCSLLYELTGATILPVCPTCMSFGTNPASTAALEAPTVKNNKLTYCIRVGPTSLRKLLCLTEFLFLPPVHECLPAKYLELGYAL